MENSDFEPIRTFCMSLPGTSEDIKWATNLCMLVEDKMFCVIELDTPHEITFKVPADKFDEMLAQPGILPAPYLARAKWVMAPHPAYFKMDEWKQHLMSSYRAILSKLPVKIRKPIEAELENFSI